tara:strand:- start:17789 stop:18691 length:903 start_codon:yes stop_codon:yes gene_type:complete
MADLDPTSKMKKGYLDEYGRFLQAPDYFDEYTTPDDIKRAQEAAFAEYGVNAGVGALGLAGQEALSFKDTAQDTKNKSELGKLEGLEKRGKLGLTGEERSTYERGLLNPVKAMGAEQGRRDEARLASGSAGKSAADVVRVQRESNRRLDDAGLQAAQKIEQAHLQRKADQRQEMEERRSYESGRETQRLNLISETIPGILANVGKVAAGVALPAKMTDAQIIRMQQQTDAAGKPLWPGLVGKNMADARALLSGAAWETKARRTAQEGDAAATGADAQASASPGGAPMRHGPDTLGITGEF